MFKFKKCFLKITSLFVILTFALLLTPSVYAKSVSVKGGITKKGTYRPPHYRTSPNKTKTDNWSTKGNVNPYTGKKGTKGATE